MLLNHFRILMTIAPAIAILLSGCHCMGISERYGDVIDRVADQQLCMDQCYRPGLDLTRLCRGCIHQEALVRNIGVYPNNNWHGTAPVEPVSPPVEAIEPIEEDEYSPVPPPPVPPVPAAELPVIDINNLKEISYSSPDEKSETDTDVEFLMPKAKQVGGPVEAASAEEPFQEETLVPLDSIDVIELNLKSTGTGPLSTPASVPPSQQFYNLNSNQQ